MGVQTALDGVREASTIVGAMHAAEDLAFESARDPGSRTLRLLERALEGPDQVVAIAATHALAGLLDNEAGRILGRLLSDDREFVREHAAWALGSGLPRFDAIGRLMRMVADGGFAGMLAQRTLEEWSDVAGGALAVGLEGALLGTRAPEARARLVESMGLVRDPVAAGVLRRIAADASEPEGVRVAAVAALGQRPGDAAGRDLVEHLAAGSGFVASTAQLALLDLDAGSRPLRARGPGLAVAQLFLHADIDPALSAAGAGDNGGIATLLVRLGDALAGTPGIERVVTLSRGSVRDAVADLLALDADRAPGHRYGRVPLLHEPTAAAVAWPTRVAARRGIRRVLRAVGGVDVLHLRMADVGSLAAADVARELGIPVVFSLAPDPHAVIESLDRAGRLARDDFGRADLSEHYWFRMRLVQRLAANAAHTVLFPRPSLVEDLRRLVRVDLGSQPERHTIVPEGVDLDTVDAALADAAAHAAGEPAVPALADLRDLLDGLAPERRGLPIVVSVGRMHRVKGTATLVEAWARSPLAERANLLIVGGDLVAPSADEREQLDRIDALVPEERRTAMGLILAGHRPNDVAARWLAAARTGVPGLAAPGGVYACASLKEEFGIALLEAMATGLVVVAPDGGGPATYVEDGVTGILTATWDPTRLSDALDTAMTLVRDDRDGSQVARSRAVVRERFTVQRMSAVLAEVYRMVVREEAALLAPSDGAR